ncbi:MAG: type IV toxin-antitoxin system AbiEi family antitoxin domain-containing protein [Microgenomates group bacterium]
MNIKADFLDKLKEFKKKYLTLADFEKLLGRERESLRVLIHRLVKDGFLDQLKPGVYIIPDNLAYLDEIANQLYFPSYLSFVSALSRYGIINQIPYSLTFATLKKSKKMMLGETEVVYSQLAPELYFGYKLEGGINIARPEKALLDQIYLASLGKAYIDYKELTLINLDKKIFEEYSRKFPKRIRKGLKEVKKRWGQVFVGVK